MRSFNSNYHLPLPENLALAYALQPMLKSKTSVKIYRPHSGVSLHQILPRFSLRDHLIFCNGVELDLKRKPMTLKLMRIFCQNPLEECFRDDLINQIYDYFRPNEKTERFRDVLKQNLTKLVSRARMLAEQRFNPRNLLWIEFFPYDSVRESWQFFRLKNEYLLRLEEEIEKQFPAS